MEFNLREHIGEKRLTENVISKMYREVDLIFYTLREYLYYLDDLITYKELRNSINNIQSHSSINSDGDVQNLESGEYIDSMLDVNNIIYEFKKLRINRKEINELKRYYRKNLREFMKRKKNSFLV